MQRLLWMTWPILASASNAGDSVPTAAETLESRSNNWRDSTSKINDRRCLGGFEFSFKLSLPAFADRQAAITEFDDSLKKLQDQFSWFDWYKGKTQDRMQVVRVLDTPDNDFQNANIQLRWRRVIAGKEGKIGVTDMVLKDQSLSHHVTEKMPVKPKHKWNKFWHCKTEANVYAHGPVDWQKGAKVMSRHPDGTFTQMFPTHPRYFGNVSRLFPWVSHQVGLSPSAGEKPGPSLAQAIEEIPLNVVKTEWRWLRKYKFKFAGEILKAVVTIQYENRTDMEVYKAQPINADFEWKTREGTRSWEQNAHSDELLLWLTSHSRFANQSYGLAPAASVKLAGIREYSKISTILLSSIVIIAVLGTMMLFVSRKRSRCLQEDCDSNVYMQITA